MIQLPNIDDETEALFSHLRGLINGEEDEDLTLVDDFAVGINFHSPSLYSFVDQNSLYNPVINNLVQLLLRVIPNSSPPYSDLLQKLLARLSFEEISVYIPKEAILESLSNPITQGFTLRILANRIPRDEAAVDFFAKNNLIYALITEFVQKNEDSPALSSYLPVLVKGMVSAKPELLQPENFEFLTKYTEDNILTSDTFTNYVISLSALEPIDFSGQAWGSQLFSIEFSKVLEFQKQQSKGNLLPLIVATYLKYVGKVPFLWLKKFFADLLDHVFLNYPNRLAEDFTNEYTIAYKDVFSGLFKSDGEPLEFALEFLSRPGVDVIDMNEPTSGNFFAQIHLENIPEKKKFFEEHFLDLNMKSGNLFSVQCVTILATNETFFNLLVENKMLTSDNVKNWTKNFLFNFLRVLAGADFSAQYLVSELPYLVSTYLLTVDRTMSDQDIWNYKKEALRKLLLHRKIDLGPWKKGLSDCLYEMENGRRFDDIEPQVGIMNDRY